MVVDDEGPGIPADKLEDIFKRFYSDRPQTDRTVGKNSGLGLSISREIVDAYGGTHLGQQPHGLAGCRRPRLDEQAPSFASGGPGVAGARFTVRLPAADATASRGAP